MTKQKSCLTILLAFLYQFMLVLSSDVVTQVVVLFFFYKYCIEKVQCLILDAGKSIALANHFQELFRKQAQAREGPQWYVHYRYTLFYYFFYRTHSKFRLFITLPNPSGKVNCHPLSETAHTIYCNMCQFQSVPPLRLI